MAMVVNYNLPMNKITREIVEEAFKKLAEAPKNKPFELADILRGNPLWEANPSKHGGAGKAFYIQVVEKHDRVAGAGDAFYIQIAGELCIIRVLNVSPLQYVIEQAAGV